MKFIKRFSEWFFIKEATDYQKHRPPIFREREIWWCSVGENVGVEISGKGHYFRRPVLVIKKLDRYSFLGIPMTSQDKRGTWYQVISHENRSITVIVSQIRHFDYRRMDKLIGTVDTKTYHVVLDKLLSLLIK